MLLLETTPVKHAALGDRWAQPDIAGQLPLRFGTGFHVFALAIGCPRCHRAIAAPMLRGTVTWMSGTLVQIEAVSRCAACGDAPVDLRLYDDGRLLVRDESGWHERRARLSWWVRLLHAFGINPTLRCSMERQVERAGAQLRHGEDMRP